MLKRVDNAFTPPIFLTLIFSKLVLKYRKFKMKKKYWTDFTERKKNLYRALFIIFLIASGIYKSIELYLQNGIMGRLGGAIQGLLRGVYIGIPIYYIFQIIYKKNEWLNFKKSLKGFVHIMLLIIITTLFILGYFGVIDKWINNILPKWVYI